MRIEKAGVTTGTYATLVAYADNVLRWRSSNAYPTSITVAGAPRAATMDALATRLKNRARLRSFR